MQGPGGGAGKSFRRPRYDGSPVRAPRVSTGAFLRLCQISLGLVALNIVSGAAVRLSDSGLGCPDWPTCSKSSITPALSLHPLIEFGNRMVVVVVCAGAAVTLIAAVLRRQRRKDLVWLSAGLVAGIIGEAVLGAVVVYSKLNPYAVMAHFMVGIGLLTVGIVLALKAGRGPGRGTLKVSSGQRTLSWVMLGVLALVIVAGTATTGSGPHAGGPGAKRIPVPLSDMARTHSAIVIVLAALTLFMLYRLQRTDAPTSVLDRGRLLLVAMVAQGFIGYTQYFTHLPAALVEVHVFGATVVWTAMLWFHDGLVHHPAESIEPADPIDPENESTAPVVERVGAT
jgi:heme a synthase